jgi:hypothetical protein
VGSRGGSEREVVVEEAWRSRHVVDLNADDAIGRLSGIGTAGRGNEMVRELRKENLLLLRIDNGGVGVDWLPREIQLAKQLVADRGREERPVVALRRLQRSKIWGGGGEDDVAWWESELGRRIGNC